MKTIQELTTKYLKLMRKAEECTERKQAIKLIRKSTKVRDKINEAYAAQ